MLKNSGNKPKNHLNFGVGIKKNQLTMKKIFKLLICALIVSCSSSDDGGPSVGGPTNPTDDDPVVNQYLQEFSDFPIGNIVSASKLSSSSAANTTFKNVLLDDYNSITAENDMKMANIFVGPDTFDFSDGDAIVAYAKANGLRVHGHTLLWHPEYAIPDWLENFSGTDAEFEAHIENYVKTTVAHFAAETDGNGNSIVSGWDVVNEYFDGSDIRSTLFTQRMGSDYIKRVFQWAREADPNVKLFYNDYNVVIQTKRQAIINMVNEFIAEGIPIDGIGLQMHLNFEWPSASDISNALNDITNTGLLVHVSELDIGANPNNDITSLTSQRAELQADQYQRVSYYYTENVPANQQYGITIWGFRDQDSWRYDGGTDWPLLYDNSYNTKPSYDGFSAGLSSIPVN